MRNTAAIVALLCASAVGPALSQSLGLSAPTSQQSQPSRQQAARPSHLDPDPNQGRFVAFGGEFGTLRVPCTQCHQLDGTADPSGAFPRLAGQSAWYLYSTLRDFADGKRPSDVMAPIAGELSDSQMQDVAAFYATLPAQPSPPPVAPDQQEIRRGQGIARTGVGQSGIPACDGCHGQQGAGDPPIVPYLAGQFASYLQMQLEAFKADRRKGDPMGVMRSIAKRLSDQQIQAVSAYYASVSPQQVAPGGMQLGNAQGGSAAAAGSAPSRAKTNAAGNAEQTQHVGATNNPQPGQGAQVVPGVSPFRK